MSAFATLSARTLWRACAQSSRVRNIDRIGISVMPMTPPPSQTPPARYGGARQTLPGVWLMAGKGRPHRLVQLGSPARLKWPQTGTDPQIATLFVNPLLVFRAANSA